MSKKTQAAVKKYGTDDCIFAYAEHLKGNGASTIAWMMGLTFGQANAAINAGRELFEVAA